MQPTDLLFISDIPLRKKIINAIDTISGLYLIEKDTNYPRELSKEIRRTIVLYAASIIEASLLFLYKRKASPILKTEYADVHTLPLSLQNGSQNKLVIARQVQSPRDERELMLDVLLKFYTSKEKIIPKSLAEKIIKAKDIRNTFHLSKSRSGLVVSAKVMQLSTDAVYETIVIVKNSL